MQTSPEMPREYNSEHEQNSSQQAAIGIQRTLMERSPLDKLAWIDRYSPAFRKLFDENREKYMELYRENPEELYAAIEQALEPQN